MTNECKHLRNDWHTPKRNHKTCLDCTEVQPMTAQECWVHREEFVDPSWKELGQDT